VFAGLGRFAYRRRRLILAVWLIAFAAGLAGTVTLARHLKGGGFSSPDTPAQQALALMQRRLKLGLAAVTVVFTSPTLDARGVDFQRREAQALAGITPRAFPGLERVQTFAGSGDRLLVSRQGHASLALLVFAVTIDKVQHQIPRLRASLRPVGLTAYVTGDPAVYEDIERVSASDLRQAETYTLPIALLVLLLAFGTLVAAALPVAGGGMAVTVTLGVLSLLARVTSLSIFVMNVATLLGLAVGIDYALFMVGRFREELARGLTVAEAVETTVAHAGRSIFYSGLAVMVGLLGLMTFKYMALRSIGIGGALVVLFSVTAALTLLPALLALLGPRVNSLRVFWRPGHEGRFWRRWSRWVMRRPVGILLGTSAVVLLFAWPVLHIQVDVPSAVTLPERSESRQGYDVIQRQFDLSALDPIDVLLTWRQGASGGGDPYGAANLAALYDYSRRLRALPGVATVTSIADPTPLPNAGSLVNFWLALGRAPAGEPPAAGPGVAPPAALLRSLSVAQRRQAEALAAGTTAPGTVLLRVASRSDPSSPAAQRLAAAIRGLAPPPGTTVHVAGLSAGIHDYVHDLFGRFPWIVAFVLCVTYVVLLFLLRSVILPLKAVIVNTLSLLASFGAVVWVFQYGHLAWLLHFAPAHVVDADLPLLMFCTVFGISMDYEVFLLTRMREEWLATRDNQESVGFGLAASGRIVTSAALIIVVVAGSFAFTSIVITKMIGVGLAVAVALDASVIRVLMVPAAMRLLGDLNWWLPDWLDKMLPALGEDSRA
jgi:RND superfamily putative drug exporter